MLVNGLQKVECRLDEQEIDRIVRETIYKKFNIDRSYYVNLEGNLCHSWFERLGSHGHQHDDVVRKATPDDLAALAVLQKFKHL